MKTTLAFVSILSSALVCTSAFSVDYTGIKVVNNTTSNVKLTYAYMSQPDPTYASGLYSTTVAAGTTFHSAAVGGVSNGRYGITRIGLSRPSVSACASNIDSCDIKTTPETYWSGHLGLISTMCYPGYHVTVTISSTDDVSQPNYWVGADNNFGSPVTYAYAECEAGTS